MSTLEPALSLVFIWEGKTRENSELFAHVSDEMTLLQKIENALIATVSLAQQFYQLLAL